MHRVSKKNKNKQKQKQKTNMKTKPATMQGTFFTSNKCCESKTFELVKKHCSLAIFGAKMKPNSLTVFEQ